MKTIVLSALPCLHARVRSTQTSFCGITEPFFLAKEYPSFNHYPGIKDKRDRMFAGITRFHKSYPAFRKKAEELLKAMK